jgi:D-glycero-beta-D-manno-heptose 1-phosphate adenylyltransferase
MSPTLKNVLDGSCGVEGKYIPDFNDLEVIIRMLKEGGYSTVLTQGVYDMFHVGHKRYLEDASKFANVLIVGVDSDELTRETKGKADPSRPFDRFEDRIELLSGLYFIKILTRRHTDRHTDDLIKLVRPDVLVISKTTSSFTEEKKKELEEFCGRVEHLEPRADPSATSTTAKVRRLRAEGGRELAELLSQSIQKTVESYLNGGTDVGS